MAHLLIVDDEPSICWGLSKLAAQMGHTVAAAASAEEGLRLAAAQRPDAIILDVRLPGLDGLSAMPSFREVCGNVPILVITAFGELGTAVAAVRNGAFDYLTKPFELTVAQRTIQRALLAPTETAKAASPAADDTLLVGSSPAMQEVFKRIALVAATDTCVHLRGESGTGKELVARAIHRYSRRCEGPFVAVNIAALSSSLAESELFGHVRGAFTGADEPRRGLLQQAHGGTIFLDEVADIPLPIQVKLLRALEHGEILPVGGNQPVESDFRIISATHRNLAERVADGSFRHDLYFRLITFEIELPPLRERQQDLRELTEHFLDRLAAKNGTSRPTVAAETLAWLEKQAWHGNVRELRNAIEHAMVLARGGVLLPDHLPPPAPPIVTAGPTTDEEIAALVRQWAEAQLQEHPEPTDLYDRLLRLVEPPLLKVVMEHCQGQCATAARLLGLHRTTLRKKLDERS